VHKNNYIKKYIQSFSNSVLFYVLRQLMINANVLLAYDIHKFHAIPRPSCFLMSFPTLPFLYWIWLGWS